MVAATATHEVLTETAWQARRAAHETRVDGWIGGHRERAARGQPHPVEDFLFNYYSFRPGWLRRWQPGLGVTLAGEAARALLTRPEYQESGDGVALNPAALPAKRREFVAWLRDYLTATAARPPFFGCFGWHEWAMVYRQSADEVRHHKHPLRFPPDEIARIVESGPGCCTHFDAFRFFTPPARPLNRHQPTRESAVELDQRGCLHANMDLYKWAYKLVPWCPAELVADCFALARDIREVDMRASPYDLQHLGYAPIMIETAAGRADYERHQRAFTTRGEPLRARLLALCNALLGA